MATDPKPDYVDLAKVEIPQADEQQRLLANVLTTVSLDSMPLPRFWYLPRGEKAAVVLTADEHDGGDVADRFESELAASPSSCKVDDWGCVRSTSYLYPTYGGLTSAQAVAYEQQGFEIALHVDTKCNSCARSTFAAALSTQLTDLATLFPGVLPSATSRNHCIAWTECTAVPEEEAQQGIHLDTNCYYWPGTWITDRPGLFTGSGFAQRFAQEDGDLIDVYQATTQLTVESDQTYPLHPEQLIANDGTSGRLAASIRRPRTPACR